MFAQKMETPAEITYYQNGGTKYQPLMEFVYELEGQTELLNIKKITKTLMGRDVIYCHHNWQLSFRSCLNTKFQ